MMPLCCENVSDACMLTGTSFGIRGIRPHLIWGFAFCQAIEPAITYTLESAVLFRSGDLGLQDTTIVLLTGSEKAADLRGCSRQRGTQGLDQRTPSLSKVSVSSRRKRQDERFCRGRPFFFDTTYAACQGYSSR